MKSLLYQTQWGWKTGGLILGAAFLLAVVLVKPIGVSTQFVILDGIAWSAASEGLIHKHAQSKTGYASPNAYLNKSGGKYAKHVDNPLNYSFIFVLAMVLGGLIASRLGRSTEDDPVSPEVWRQRFGDSKGKRLFAAFFGGFLVLLGARLAGGCTSGHMMSGMMQTSLSGYLFAAGAFATAIPLAMIMYRKGA